MKKAIIGSNSTLLDGGCNVCSIIEDVSYTLTIDQQSIPLEEVTVSNLIMLIAMENGFKREYKMDVLDDYVIFKNETIEVTLKEEYDFLTYQSEDKELQTTNQINNNEQLAVKVNEILTTLFTIEALEFDFLSMDKKLSI